MNGDFVGLVGDLIAFRQQSLSPRRQADQLHPAVIAVPPSPDKPHLLQPVDLAGNGGVIEEHLVAIGFMEAGSALKVDPEAQVSVQPRGPACPKCGQYAMRMAEGCMTCAECGHSKCG